jgi:hypothetical protein
MSTVNFPKDKARYLMFQPLAVYLDRDWPALSGPTVQLLLREDYETLTHLVPKAAARPDCPDDVKALLRKLFRPNIRAVQDEQEKAKQAFNALSSKAGGTS